MVVYGCLWLLLVVYGCHFGSLVIILFMFVILIPWGSFVTQLWNFNKLLWKDIGMHAGRAILLRKHP
jgi:hypothetical protein